MPTKSYTVATRKAMCAVRHTRFTRCLSWHIFSILKGLFTVHKLN